MDEVKGFRGNSNILLCGIKAGLSLTSYSIIQPTSLYHIQVTLFSSLLFRSEPLRCSPSLSSRPSLLLPATPQPSLTKSLYDFTGRLFHSLFHSLPHLYSLQMTNKCTSGSPVFLYEADGTPQGPATIEGQLLGGIAWLDGFAGADCQSSGVNCGVVEFTLRNDDPFQNAADFSFQTQGNHL